MTAASLHTNCNWWFIHSKFESLTSATSPPSMWVEPWIFWFVAFVIGLLLICLIQHVNRFLISGRWDSCSRHVACNEWRQCNGTWYLFNFGYLFFLALLSGYAWYYGLVFLLAFKLFDFILCFACGRWFHGKCSNCCIEILVGFLAYLLGLVFRRCLCYFPPSKCF